MVIAGRFVVTVVVSSSCSSSSVLGIVFAIAVVNIDFIGNYYYFDFTESDGSWSEFDVKLVGRGVVGKFITSDSNAAK